MVSVELDLNELEPVPLTTARALGLQTELYLKWSDPQFQRKLSALRATYSRDPEEFRKHRQALLFSIEREVLPTYGYEASARGAAQLRRAFAQVAGDPLVRAGREVISHSVGCPEEGQESSGVHEEDWLALLGPPTDGIPNGEAGESSSESVVSVPPREATTAVEEALAHQEAAAAAAAARAEHMRTVGDMQDLWLGSNGRAEAEVEAAGPQAGGPGVEIDLAHVPVPLTKERAVALQNELIERFSSSSFQDTLKLLEARHAASTPEFRRQRQRLAMGVQAKVLPKYGYEGNLAGVSNLLHELDEKFAGDEEIQKNIKVVDRLLAAAHTASAEANAREAELLPSQRKGWATDSTEISVTGAATPMRRRTHPVSWVGEKDGFWQVVGGKRTGGLLVRLGEDMNSPAWHELLATGAVVKAVMQVGERLNYEKVTGDGPNYGWISMHFRGKDLLKRYAGEVPLDLHTFC